MTKTITVDELNKIVKQAIIDLNVDNIILTGEIADLKLSRNNLYYIIKGKKSQINGVHWNYTGNVKNGDMVNIRGKLSVWEKSGRYQVSSKKIEILGTGDKYLEQEKLKRELKLLGYFDKKKIEPKKIVNIGLITALDGAAIKDFLYVLENNNFIGNVYVKGGYVQGANCPKSIKECIEYFNNDFDKSLDVIVVTRGGGSWDDLSGFSSREVVHAIHDSKIPVISAIGHEVDTMLSDYACDIRCPTPSLAGKYIINNNNALFDLAFIDEYVNSCETELNYMINVTQEKIKHFIEKTDNLNNAQVYCGDIMINNAQDIYNFDENEYITIKLKDGILKIKRSNILVKKLN